MKTKFLILIALAGFIGFSTNSFAKTRVQIEKVSGTGVTKNELQVLESLIRSEILTYDHLKLVKRREDLKISAELTRLKKTYVLAMSLDDGSDVRLYKEKVRHFDDVDRGVSRLMADLFENADDEEVVAEDDYEDEPVRQSHRRIHPRPRFQFSVGAAYPVTNSFFNDDTMYAFSGSYFYDLGRTFLEFRTDVQSSYEDFSQNISTLTAGLQYFVVSTPEFGLYGGLEAGVGYADDGFFDSVIGFATAGSVGMRFLRSSPVQIDLRFRMAMITARLNGEFPTTSSILIGLVF